MWYAMSSTGSIGPFFFEDADGHTQTVNRERYVDILKRFWVALQRGSPGADRLWFQQDGATPHTARVTLRWLEERFGTRLISRGTDTPRPAHSPDLTPLDFYLWGFLKSIVCKEDTKSLTELKTAIRRALWLVSAAMCARAIDGVMKRVNVCHLRKGSHLEDVL